ncbi:MAG: zinc-ribbon domain-containing protein, partial [Acidobacteria bacterium]|nr:zinc-ribbon domain-containing protein [Acidobacteriota bacterium]
MSTSASWNSCFRSAGASLLALALLGSSARGIAQESVPAAPAPAPIYCPVCGAQNKAGSKFCLKDGTPLPALDP